MEPVWWRLIYAGTNSILTGLMVFYGLRVLHHFNDHLDVAVASFFIRKESVPAFEFMSFALIFFATITFLVAFSLLPRFPWYEFSIIVLFIGLSYFMYMADKITRLRKGSQQSIE